MEFCKAELEKKYRGKFDDDFAEFLQATQSSIGVPTYDHLEETLHHLQTENSKLRSRLSSKDSKGVVGFGNVSTMEFLPAQGQGVPSGGGAPLGMEMRAIRGRVENINLFEQRREAQRKGINRIPEQKRIEILKDVGGVSEDSLQEEALMLDHLQRKRMESVASPTDNPLPDYQRDLYRKMLNNS
jgi:hypothetical protein